jgi:hypothetical protein
MRRKIRPLSKEEIEKLPISKKSPIDKIDRYSEPFLHHKIIVNQVKKYNEKATQDRIERRGSDTKNLYLDEIES